MFVSHSWQLEVKYFLFWHGFAPYHGIGKSLVDDCGLTLQTQWLGNAVKRDKFNFQLPSMAQKRLCLGSLLSTVHLYHIFPCLEHTEENK